MFIDGINLLDLRLTAYIETETEIFQMYSYNGGHPYILSTSDYVFLLVYAGR